MKRVFWLPEPVFDVMGTLVCRRRFVLKELKGKTQLNQEFFKNWPDNLDSSIRRHTQIIDIFADIRNSMSAGRNKVYWDPGRL